MTVPVWMLTTSATNVSIIASPNKNFIIAPSFQSFYYYGTTNCLKVQKKPFKMGFLLGAPETIRTSDFTLRRRTLYPTELQAHGYFLVGYQNYIFLHQKCRIFAKRCFFSFWLCYAVSCCKSVAFPFAVRFYNGHTSSQIIPVAPNYHKRLQIRRRTLYPTEL